MTALSKPRQTQSRKRASDVLGLAANVKLYAGALVVLDASGNIKPGVTAVGLMGVGVSRDTYDNTGGAAGAVAGEYEIGIFKFANSTSTDLITNADIKKTAYVVDDQTVAKTNGTATRSPAGIIVGVDPTDGGVWIDFTAGNIA
jgi:hypothetical protein